MYEASEHAHHEPVYAHHGAHDEHHLMTNDETVAQYPVELDLHQETNMEPHYEGSGIYADHEHTMSHQPWHMYG